MKNNRWWLVAAVAAMLTCGLAQVQAQNNDRGNRGQGGQPGQGGQGGDRGGRWDPAQMQERMMTFYKEQLEITDDTEWKAIEPLVKKVMDARIAGFGGGRGMFGGRGGGPGGPGGGPGGTGATGSTRSSNPEADTLQKAIDAKASSAELKTAMAKDAEARKAKQAELEKAQADLRKVLTVRQEALATLRGLL